MSIVSTNIARQIVLDTETTGMNKLGIHFEGHRIIEIGAVEIINRRLTGRHFHVYLKPDRLVDPDAFNIHRISNDFLENKPIFADIADEFLQFICGSELIIHNAPFDIEFIDYEFAMLNRGIAKTNTFCKVTDSLILAQKMFPGKHNSLDALCSRYFIDNSRRIHHGALLDAKILADIFLLMSGEQTAMCFAIKKEQRHREVSDKVQIQRVHHPQSAINIIYATDKEIAAHEQQLDIVQKKSGRCLWRETSSAQSE